MLRNAQDAHEEKRAESTRGALAYATQCAGRARREVRRKCTWRIKPPSAKPSRAKCSTGSFNPGRGPSVRSKRRARCRLDNLVAGVCYATRGTRTKRSARKAHAVRRGMLRNARDTREEKRAESARGGIKPSSARPSRAKCSTGSPKCS